MMRRTVRAGFVAMVLSVSVSCVSGSVCERQLEYEEEDCFPELEQPTDVDKDECTGDAKAYAQCAMRNKDDYCTYFLWQNRGAARREGYTVSDTLPQRNQFVECLDDANLRER
jgi:hypothetical protein